MTRAHALDAELQRRVLGDLLHPRENPFPEDRPAQLDDLVFLSAALTRLVIDPYREPCSTRTRISRTEGIGSLPKGAPWVELEQPFLLTGFDEAPENVRQAVAMALSATGCGYIGRFALPRNGGATHGEVEGRFPWFQLLRPGDAPNPGAHGLIHCRQAAGGVAGPLRLHPDQLVGIAISKSTLGAALPYALDHPMDFVLLDGVQGIHRPWMELESGTQWTLMRDALRLLRELQREEEIALLHFGGMRSGTDVAKILALNGQACVFGVAAGLALGAAIEGASLRFNPAASPDELSGALVNWIRGCSQETAIIARCTGKTRVHNLEPEDMRSISLAARDAFDIPLASGQEPRSSF